jgi:transcriptional regulator with XRE-family HTH domain
MEEQTFGIDYHTLDMVSIHTQSVFGENSMSEKLSIADSLRTIRQFIGVSQVALGEAAGLSSGYVALLENKIRQGSLESVQALAGALCCTPTDLFSPPDSQRLLQIRAAYLRRQADEAQAAAESGAA